MTVANDGLMSIAASDTAITISLVTTQQVAVAEAVLILNPAIVNVRQKNVIAPGGKLSDHVVYLNYQNETTSTKMIEGDLFRLDISSHDSAISELELLYFLGKTNGGAIPGLDWQPLIVAGHRLTATLNLLAGKCKPDTGCYWAEPEMTSTDDPFRVLDGATAAKSFVYGRMGDWAQYQTISVTQGNYYKFSANLMAWQCTKGCPTNPYSDNPYDMSLRVGIDPYGGSDPLSSSVAWSLPGNSYDHWSEFSVIAQAKSRSLTVFWWASPRFDWARINNDVYADEASLVEIHPSVVFVPVVIF